MKENGVLDLSKSQLWFLKSDDFGLRESYVHKQSKALSKHKKLKRFEHTDKQTDRNSILLHSFIIIRGYPENLNCLQIIIQYIIFLIGPKIILPVRSSLGARALKQLAYLAPIAPRSTCYYFSYIHLLLCDAIDNEEYEQLAQWSQGNK